MTQAQSPDQPEAKGHSAGSSKAKAAASDAAQTVRLVIAAIGLILLIAFAVANSESVKVSFVFVSAKVSLIWVIVISAVLGAVVDRLMILVNHRRKAKR
jgi:hypothetical protein